MNKYIARFIVLALLGFLCLGFSVHKGDSGGIAGLNKTCKYMEDPADGEDFEALFGHFLEDITAVSMWCRTEGGTDVDLHLYDQDEDDSKTTFTTSTDFTCDNGPGADEGRTDDFTNILIEAGHDIGMVTTDVDGAVTTLIVCVTFE